MAVTGYRVGSGLKPKEPYKEMISEAISFHQSRKGTSRVAIYNFITANYDLGGSSEKKVRNHLNLILKAELLKGNLKKNKDSYKIVSEKEKKAKLLDGDKLSTSLPKKADAPKSKSTTTTINKAASTKPSKKRAQVSSNAVKSPKAKRIVQKLNTKSPNTPKRSVKPSTAVSPKKSKKMASQMVMPKTPKKTVAVKRIV